MATAFPDTIDDLDASFTGDNTFFADVLVAASAEQSPDASETPDHAPTILHVCRNEWNTIDTRGLGVHWFSA